MSKTPAEIIGTREHAGLAAKRDIWRLVHQSYKGGIEYITGGNLFQYRIEDNLRYKQRQERADFTNHVQEIIDMIAGFISAKPVERNIKNDDLQYIINNISKGKSMDAFMHSLTFNCLKSTCGVLIDSPAFQNPDMSKAERKMKNINPYAVYYPYTNICDFEIGEDGELLWVILDNSYVDKSDPVREPQKVTVRRLWTRVFYQDAKKVRTDRNSEEWILGKEINHGRGVVPFVMSNSRDVENDLICDSPFEDIALKSRKIFNIASWCDETLAGSSFQILFFPYKNDSDIKNITKMFKSEEGGMSDIPLIPFNGELSAKPYFDGAKIDNIDKYIVLADHYTAEILAKFGMKTDSKGSWESGVAKSIDFDKTESFLRGVARQLQETEKRIAKICGRWEDKDVELECKYPDNFEADDIDKELNRLAQAFTIPSKKLQQKAHKAMITKIFPDIEQSELDEIMQEIDSDENPDPDDNTGDEDKNSDGTLKTANQSTGLKKEKSV